MVFEDTEQNYNKYLNNMYDFFGDLYSFTEQYENKERAMTEFVYALITDIRYAHGFISDNDVRADFYRNDIESRMNFKTGFMAGQIVKSIMDMPTDGKKRFQEKIKNGRYKKEPRISPEQMAKLIDDECYLSLSRKICQYSEYTTLFSLLYVNEKIREQRKEKVKVKS